MPKIINAYADHAGESVAGSLKSLGESMFGDQAKNQVYRETAMEKGRHNANAEPYARALRDHDASAALYYGSQAGHLGQDLGAGNLAAAAAGAGKNYADPTLATAALGAGHSFGGTVPGERENIAQRANAAHEATVRAAASSEAIAARELAARQYLFEHTPEKVEQDGHIVLQPRSTAMGMPSGENVNLANARTLNDQTTARTLEAAKYARDNTPTTIYDNNTPTIVPQSEAVRGGHAGAPLTTEQMIATSPAFRAGLGGQPAGDGTVPVGQSEPAEPATPAGYIHPLVQKALGYGQGAVPFQHLQSGAIGQSYDGGKTVDGHSAGPGWVPVTSQDAVGQTRTNEQIQNAGQPLPAAPTAYSQVAQDAAATSGAKSLVQSEANKTLGFFGGPEIGANTNRARENLTNLANEARSVVLSSPGRAAVQAQRWANASIPQPGALGMTGANADQQKNAVITFTQHLRSIYQTEAQEAQDRATPPAERAKIIQHMAQLKRIIGAYEAPAGQSQGPSGAPQTGAPPQAAARPRATNPQTGQKIEFDGQAWVPVQ